jgi:O-antigen/teichoic acid export membrane protein
MARAIGEIVGKLASLALFIAVGRKVGQAGLGSFVFAFAFVSLASVPVDLGYERWLIREIARDRSAIDRLLFNVMVLKLVQALPVAVVATPILFLIAPGRQARETVYVLAGGILIDSLSRTLFSVYTAIERSGILALSLVVQRVSAAALGILALSEGHGVVTVAAAYGAGAALGFALAVLWLPRAIGRLRPAIAPRTWPHLIRQSLPFAVQDVFTMMLFRIDAVILAAIGTAVAVGRYGAAYRLFESTLFISFSLAGAFAAMYTYLGPDTVPTVGAVFQRSVKLALVLLAPVSAAFAVLAGPLTKLLFGASLEAAAEPLRILAPAVVLLGVVNLSSSLFVSRRDPRAIVRVTGAMAALNVALNFALIPVLEDRGAAIAMLVTEALYCAAALRMAAVAAGGVTWIAMVAAPLAAAAAMVPVMLALSGSLAPALAAGSAVYLAVYIAVERAVAPGDLRFAVSLIRRFLRMRPAA